MKWVKVTIVVCGALLVTALGIDAADTLTGKSGTLLSSVLSSEASCDDGMVAVDTIPGISCIDQYERSTGTECPVRTPGNSLESHKNTETSSCLPVSEKDAIPWTFVTRDQALALCARAGKRLPTSAEWYALALGQSGSEQGCNSNSSGAAKTGSYTSCESPTHAFDLIGNVWEWVSDDVVNGQYGGRTLPESGYVSEVDTTGVAITTQTDEQELYGQDYFWGSDAEGVFGMIRGGFYGSGSDGGLYAVHADTKSNAASAGIGFRCVE